MWHYLANRNINIHIIPRVYVLVLSLGSMNYFITWNSSRLLRKNCAVTQLLWIKSRFLNLIFYCVSARLRELGQMVHSNTTTACNKFCQAKIAFADICHLWTVLTTSRWKQNKETLIVFHQCNSKTKIFDQFQGEYHITATVPNMV